MVNLLLSIFIIFNVRARDNALYCDRCDYLHLGLLLDSLSGRFLIELYSIREQIRNERLENVIFLMLMKRKSVSFCASGAAFRVCAFIPG